MTSSLLPWCLLLVAVLFVPKSQASTPVENYGELTVQGNTIVDQRGSPVQLRGMSFFWSQWQGDYWNNAVVEWLIDDWQVTVVRAAMGVEHNGYLTAPIKHRKKVEYIVKSALSRGIYVIVDWHDHNAPDHLKQAKSFFADMARIYGTHPNIIYEIFNEPDDESWATIKTYAKEIIQSIRQHDPDNLILVGTPSWSQDVDLAAKDPIEDSNIAYTLHFYSASHGSSLRDKAVFALSRNVALFVSEWGLSEASGDGHLDPTEGQNWITFLDQHKISWCNWSIADKDESSAALKPGASTKGNWSPDELTSSGKWVRNRLRSYPRTAGGGSGTPNCKAQIPGTLHAAKYTAMLGIRTEPTTDIGGGENAAYIENGDWAEYRVRVNYSGMYTVETRVASKHTGGLLVLFVDDVEKERVNISSTGDWQRWETIKGNIYLDRGEHLLRLEFRGSDIKGLYNVNWLKFTLQRNVQATENARSRQ